MAIDILWLGVVAVVALLACSAFFSSSEIAVFSLAPDWISERAAAGDDRAAVLSGLREDSHRLLVTVLGGNNIVNIAIASIVTLLVSRVLPPGQTVTVATLVASAIVLIFGEIVPKSFGLGNAQTWALTVARPLRIVELSLLPLVIVFDLLTRRLGTLVGGVPSIEEQYREERIDGDSDETGASTPSSRS
jgi:Mg2+/Co2+ transporter CorB